MPKKETFVEPVTPPDNPPQRSYKYIATVFVIAAVVLLVGIVYLVLAQVTITLTPKSEKLTKELTVNLAEAPGNSTSTTPTIEGKIYSEKIVATVEYPLNHGGTKVDTQATGKVIIYNRRNQNQTLVATTRLLSKEGVLFRLKDKVVVPANGQIEAMVHADQAGAGGEIGPTTFTIPGLASEIQKSIYAEAVEAMSGGTREIGVLSQADIDQATESFKKSQLDKLAAKAMAQVNGTDWILVGQGVESAGQKFSVDKKVGEEISSFNLNGEMTATAVLVEKQKILSWAEEEWQKNQNEGASLVVVDPESLQYEVQTMDGAKKEALVKITVSGLASFDSSQETFDKNLLVGFTESDLKLYFSQFNTIKDVRVEFSPFWIKKVPLLKDHIKIKLQEEQ